MDEGGFMKFGASHWLPGAALLCALSALLALPASAFSGDELAVSAPAAADGGPRGPVTVSAELVANMDNGSTIWDNACAACHGEQGQGGHGGGSDIRNTALSLGQIMLEVNAGRNSMPAFAGFSEQELLDISTYVRDVLK
jgi:mono/diheme cytochrome c family protein